MTTLWRAVLHNWRIPAVPRGGSRGGNRSRIMGHVYLVWPNNLEQNWQWCMIWIFFLITNGIHRPWMTRIDSDVRTHSVRYGNFFHAQQKQLSQLRTCVTRPNECSGKYIFGSDSPFHDTWAYLKWHCTNTHECCLRYFFFFFFFFLLFVEALIADRAAWRIGEGGFRHPGHPE